MVIVTSGSPIFCLFLKMLEDDSITSEDVGSLRNWRNSGSSLKSVGKLGFPICHFTANTPYLLIISFSAFPSRRAVLPVTTLPWSRRKCFREGKLQGLQDWAATCFRMFPLWSTWWFNKIWGFQKARWFLVKGSLSRMNQWHQTQCWVRLKIMDFYKSKSKVPDPIMR